MASFLDSLGMGGGGAEVYVAVSATNTIEMATIDPKTFAIKSYAQTELEYNESLREISSYEHFKGRLSELFQACNINPQKVNVHLSLPTVWFGYKEGIPLMLDDTAITSVVMGELEQTYVFKRKEPVPYWFDALTSTNSDSRSVFYTAIQQDVKEELQQKVRELGANLVSIDCSIFSTLRGLSVTGIAAEQMENASYSWALLVVNNSGFELYGMQGKRILEYYEEPIPIRSYEGEEVYDEINNAVQVALLSSASNALVIASSTDFVSSEILAKHIQFAGTTIPVEDNKYRKEPFLDMSANIVKETQLKVSLHIIGLTTPSDILPYSLNFMSANGKESADNSKLEIPMGGQTIVLTPQKATVAAFIILVVVALLVGIPYIAIGQMRDSNIAKSGDAKARLEQVNNELQQYEAPKEEVVENAFNAEEAIETTLKNNRTKIMAYAALGESIPKELYLTYFMTGDSGYIDIQGCANSVEDVYVFFQNLKDSLIESKLRLSKLDLKSGSVETVINSDASAIDDSPYVFEITNMDDAQLRSFMANLTGAAPASNSGDDSQGNAAGGAPQPTN